LSLREKGPGDEGFQNAKGPYGSMPLLICLFLVAPLAFGRTQHERAEELLKNVFGSAVSVASSSLVVHAAEKDSLKASTGISFSRDTLKLLVADNGAKHLGYAIIDEVRGKDQPITYCIGVDENFAVKHIAVLAYREPYGGEVQNESWLNQFFGKRPGDKLRPGKEIKNITGATISARAITFGVKNILALLRIVAPRLQHSVSATK
jgi:Na+-translocating ferredoxin:NAD+ oxidoreductase RnfG subunit